ncbi:MAG: hypothetical protein U1E62_13990 [Alsobacter sp.]
MKRSILLSLAALACLGAAPASAQYYDPYYRPPPPPPGYGYGYRPPPPGYGYGRPPGYGYGYGYGRPPGYGRPGSNVCITSRGNCSTGRPLPANAPCQCFIPGFGTKRGAVASY